MIARAFLGQNPFEVWGDGTQIRNWTYIDDIVEGTIVAGEKIDDGTAINLGTMERIKGDRRGQDGLELTGHKAEIKLLPEHAHWPAEPRGRQFAGEKIAGLGAEGAVPRWPEAHH